MISDRVEPELRIAVAAPLLKQCEENFSASGTPILLKAARNTRLIFLFRKAGKSISPGAARSNIDTQNMCIGQLCFGRREFSSQKQGRKAVKPDRAFFRRANLITSRCCPWKSRRPIDAPPLNFSPDRSLSEGRARQSGSASEGTRGINRNDIC